MTEDAKPVGTEGSEPVPDDTPESTGSEYPSCPKCSHSAALHRASDGCSICPCKQDVEG